MQAVHRCKPLNVGGRFTQANTGRSSPFSSYIGRPTVIRIRDVTTLIALPSSRRTRPGHLAAPLAQSVRPAAHNTSLKWGTTFTRETGGSTWGALMQAMPWAITPHHNTKVVNSHLTRRTSTTVAR